jgi:hypothetical protein
MSLETDLQNAISSATALNQTVQGQIDTINTTLTNAVANVDSTLNAATQQAENEVATFLASGTSKRAHITSMYVPESTIIIKAAGVLGSEYDHAADVDQSIIDAENPHEMVDGFPMLAQSEVKNPFQEYYENFQDTRGGSMHAPVDANGNPCYVDLPLFNHGESLNLQSYNYANNPMGSFSSGKKTYMIMRIGVHGSPHRGHKTWIQTWGRYEGAHNAGLYTNIASPTIAQQQQVHTRGHFGRVQCANTENCGPNAPTGSFAANNHIYLAQASGYGFGNSMASNYGQWMMIPVHGTNSYPTTRIWNWGFGDLAISAIGFAFVDFEPA